RSCGRQPPKKTRRVENRLTTNCQTMPDPFFWTFFWVFLDSGTTGYDLTDYCKDLPGVTAHQPAAPARALAGAAGWCRTFARGEYSVFPLVVRGRRGVPPMQDAKEA